MTTQTVRNDKQEAARKRLRAALFVKAKNHGIEAVELREDIAPSVIGKRVSEASPKELVKLLDHVTRLYKPAPSPNPLPAGARETSSPLTGEDGGEGENIGGSLLRKDGELKKSSSLHPDNKHYRLEPKYYPSSRSGLIEELTDVARARWGDGWEKSLNAFVNSHATTAITHFRFLGVTALKALKERLKEMNEKDGR